MGGRARTTKEDKRAKAIIRQTRYRNTHREQLKEAGRLYRLAHPGHAQRWKESNKDKVRAWDKQYKLKNKDRLSTYLQKWRKDHYAELNSKRRHKRGAVEIIEHIDITQLLYMYHGACVYCGCALTLENLTIDHVLPVTRYDNIGKRCPQDYNNCVPSCRSCNSRKKDRTPLEYFWEFNRTNEVGKYVS